MITISALYVIGKDPEFLRESLQSVAPFVEQLVIVANQWQDGSDVENVLSEFPKAKVHRFKEDFSDFGERWFRDFGVRNCNNEWVLRVDSDEVLTDGWRSKLDDFLSPEMDGCTLRFYEHIGSYEYLHKGLKQDTLFALFRRKSIGGLTEGIDDRGTHSTLKVNGRVVFFPDVSVMHYGYAKSDMVSRLVNNALRGDHTSDESQQIKEAELIRERGAWEHLPEVCDITYPLEMVPNSMREKFGKTYQLTLDESGKILNREKI